MSVQRERLEEIANAIREKKGTQSPIIANDFASEIRSIPTGISPTGTINISSNGTYDVTNYENAEVSVTQGSYYVTVIDYDGTVLKSDVLCSGGTFELPEPPTHLGLLFDKWVASDTISNNSVAVTNNDIMIGATYTTVSGATEFYIHLNEATGLTKSISTSTIAGATTIDWGDGTVEQVVENSTMSHTYVAGDYVVSISNIISIGAISSFANCSTKILVGNTVTTITSLNGYQCLEYISIPNSVTSVSSLNMFSNCYALKCIILPELVTVLSEKAFYQCYSLRYAVLPLGMTTLSDSVFSNCSSLETIAIPSSITYFGVSPFAYCSSLTHIIVAGTWERVEEQMFMNCYSLVSVVFLATRMGSIFRDAFSDCHSLKTITLNSTNLYSIKENAFYNCYSLRRIDIPDTVEEIAGSAFYQCSCLATVNMGSGMRSLGASAFKNCTALSKVIFPSTITSIGSESFSGCCSAIEYDFSLFTSIPALADNTVFLGISRACKIKVPTSLYDSWCSTTNWANYISYIVAV